MQYNLTPTLNNSHNCLARIHNMTSRAPHSGAKRARARFVFTIKAALSIHTRLSTIHVTDRKAKSTNAKNS